MAFSENLNFTFKKVKFVQLKGFFAISTLSQYLLGTNGTTYRFLLLEYCRRSIFSFSVIFSDGRALEIWHTYLPVNLPIDLHLIFEISSLNWIFAGYTGSKYQVRTRQKVKFGEHDLSN